MTGNVDVISIKTILVFLRKENIWVLLGKIKPRIDKFMNHGYQRDTCGCDFTDENHLL